MYVWQSLSLCISHTVSILTSAVGHDLEWFGRNSEIFVLSSFSFVFLNLCGEKLRKICRHFTYIFYTSCLRKYSFVMLIVSHLFSQYFMVHVIHTYLHRHNNLSGDHSNTRISRFSRTKCIISSFILSMYISNETLTNRSRNQILYAFFDSLLLALTYWYFHCFFLLYSW